MNLLAVRTEGTEASNVVFANLLSLNRVLHILECMEIELLAVLTSIAKAPFVVWTLLDVVVIEPRYEVLLFVLGPDMLVKALVSLLALAIVIEIFTDG